MRRVLFDCYLIFQHTSTINFLFHARRLIPFIHTATNESIMNETGMKQSSNKKKKLSFAVLFASVPILLMSIFHIANSQLPSLSAGVKLDYEQEVAAAIIGPPTTNGSNTPKPPSLSAGIKLDYEQEVAAAITGPPTTNSSNTPKPPSLSAGIKLDYEQEVAAAITGPPTTNSSNTTPKPPRFAIAFVVSGCKPLTCTGYILNAIVTATILKHVNSTADVIFLARMSTNIAKDEDAQFDPQYETWLQKAGVHLSYLPRVSVDNFGTATLEKFRVYELLDYDRVYFMDSDIIPSCNIDSHFQASMDGRIEESVVYRGAAAPMTAAHFIVRPQPGYFAELIDIVARHRRRTTKFDKVQGWGQPLLDGRLWHWHGVGIDQGINYQWFMHQRLNVTLVSKGIGETWQEIPADQVDYWKNRSKVITSAYWNNTRFSAMITKQVRDTESHMSCSKRGHNICHYAGGGKPWKNPNKLTAENLATKTENATICHEDFWLYWLRIANTSLDLRLDSQIDATAKPPVGSGKITADTILHPSVQLPKPYCEGDNGVCRCCKQ
jgi:hypothetical protein